jgi:polyferredoxin
MIQVHPTSFIVDDIVYFFFLFKKKYFLFFCFYVLKLILILFLFIFRLISLFSFMLFRKPIWNDDFFNYLFNF